MKDPLSFPLFRDPKTKPGDVLEPVEHIPGVFQNQRTGLVCDKDGNLLSYKGGPTPEEWEAFKAKVGL